MLINLSFKSYTFLEVAAVIFLLRRAFDFNDELLLLVRMMPFEG